MKTDNLFAALLGTLAGIGIGMLIAPEKGEVTRKRIKEAALDGYDKLSSGAEQFKDKAVETKDKFISESSENLSQMKELLQQKGSEFKEDIREQLLEKIQKLEAALSKDIENE